MTTNRLCTYAGVLAVAMLCLPGFVSAEEPYAPVIDPAEFSAKIDNPFFSMPVGKTITLESQTADGLERNEIIATPETRTIMGVTTLVYWDRVWLNGKIHEETRDYLAQHKNGDVWYFGEVVDNYENGQLKDHKGSWIAGENGALPGIWMKANPQVGDTYREEYYKGEAEDMAKIASLSETVKTPLGTFQNCIKTDNWTPLDPSLKEAKFYCREVGTSALELNLTDNEKAVVVKVENGG